MNIQLIRAQPEQAPVLANLLELYAHDFSEFHELRMGADGKFGYRSLPLYWSDPDRYPFLVKVDEELAGLVFVKRGSEVTATRYVWDMAEFFVLRAYRRQGIGTQIAHTVWRQFPGPWEVRVMRSNVLALNFWSHAISSYQGEKISPVSLEKGGEGWFIFRFNTSDRG